jgi:hypothetical protein
LRDNPELVQHLRREVIQAVNPEWNPAGTAGGEGSAATAAVGGSVAKDPGAGGAADPGTAVADDLRAAEDAAK